ncbi:hypothetical protein M3Y99_00209100 [Aphelenchoides fujianensis]|nr:hypothetical protein M3Y99_00209100 [Aphelenchoides fujianensis]
MSLKLRQLERAIAGRNGTISTDLRKNRWRSPIRKTTLPPRETSLFTRRPFLVVSPGGDGSECTKHNECRPGHCCQGGVNGTHCFKHNRNEGAPCADSCECENRLQCFPVPLPAESNSGHCKRADSRDFQGRAST